MPTTILLQPNSKQSQLQELLTSSSSKGHTFLELYQNKQQKYAAMNAFELLQIRQITKIAEQLGSIEGNGSQRQPNKYEDIKECAQYCRNTINSINFCQNNKSQRRGNLACLVCCCGINIACIFSLWQILFYTPAENLFENPLNKGQLSSQYQNNSLHSLPEQNSQSVDYAIYLGQVIVFLALKLISGFWALAGCLCTSFCICACIPKYIESLGEQFRLKWNFRRKILKNRHNQ